MISENSLASVIQANNLTYTYTHKWLTYHVKDVLVSRCHGCAVYVSSTERRTVKEEILIPLVAQMNEMRVADSHFGCHREKRQIFHQIAQVNSSSS